MQTITAYLLLITASWLAVPAWANPAATGHPDPELRRILVDAIEAADSFNDRFDAEVWLVDMDARMQPFIDDEQQRLKLLRSVHREASRVDLPPELVLAVIEIESRFDSFAISRSGAQGLMQVMPFWLDEIGHPDDNLVDMDTNLRIGCTILKYYMNMEHNDLRNALARYNGSYDSGIRDYSNRVLDALRERWHQR